jgi:K+ channel tetramerisation domain.
VLSKRIGQAVDDEGRIFIDRSPDLFTILLEFMRTLERPSERTLEEHGPDAIAREALFYGVRGLSEVVRGALAPEVYMRADDRSIR